MSIVEVLTLQTEHISKRMIAATWRKLSKEPLPKIKVVLLSDEDFNNALQQRRCLEDDLREIDEWGRLLPTEGTDACIFNAEDTDEADFIILVRRNPYHTLKEILEHELAHIARGDL